MNDKIKKVVGWIGGAVLTIRAFLAYIFGTRGRGVNRRGIQRDTKIINDGQGRTEESQSRNRAATNDNRQAKSHLDRAGQNIDNAIDGLADAQEILDRARNRAKK